MKFIGEKMEQIILAVFLVPILVLIGGFSALFLISALTPWPKRRRSDFTRPVFLFDPKDNDPATFPCLIRNDARDTGPQHTAPEIYLSVVIPAMNEEDRLPAMLDECLPYLERRASDDSSFTYEVIVVDDGSKDNTANVALQYTRRFTNKKVRVLKLETNYGKGGAVRNGVLKARGGLILFADADGATRFSEIRKLEQELFNLITGKTVVDLHPEIMDHSFPAIAIGSRAHMEANSIATRSATRTVLMYGFHMLVWLFTVRKVRDTQCGFKLFTRAAAARIFPVQHIERWAFDVELLYVAQRLKMPIQEVAVHWTEVDGSKVTPVWSWIQMGRDLVLIWFRYTVGIWNDRVPL